MPAPEPIDYDRFLSRLVTALRKTWLQVRAQRPQETFYLFGIETDSDLTDLQPLCNTEEQYRADGGRRQPPPEKWFMDDDSTLYRAGSKHTRALSRELNRYVLEDPSQHSERAFRDRKKRLLNLFEQALGQLDAEGFFGTGKKRARVLLQVVIVDASDAEWRHMLQAIERLNPPESTAALFEALEQQKQQEAGQAARRPSGEQAVKRLAVEFLRKHQRAFQRCWSVRRIEPITPFLLRCIGEASPPDQLWEVSFDARDEPEARSHGAGVLIVYVIPATGKCVVAP